MVYPRCTPCTRVRVCVHALLTELLYNVGMGFEKGSITDYLSIIEYIYDIYEKVSNNMPILKAFERKVSQGFREVI